MGKESIHLLGAANATEAIRRAAEANVEDKYRDFRNLWHNRLDVIKQRFFPDFYTPTNKFDLPTPPVAIEDMRNYRYLASYHLVPDGYGLSDKLTLNKIHVIEEKGKHVWLFGEAALVETISHELAHEKVNYLIKQGKLPEDTPPHGDYFRDVVLSPLGIHCNSQGAHDRPCDDPNSPVGVLLKVWGIPLQSPFDYSGIKISEDWWDFILRFKGIERKGRSSLTKWHCPECGLNVRMGIKEDPRLRHQPCEEKTGHEVYLVLASTAVHETLNQLANSTPEVEPEPPERDIDAEVNEYEDLGMYLDRYD